MNWWHDNYLIVSVAGLAVLLAGGLFWKFWGRKVASLVAPNPLRPFVREDAVWEPGDLVAFLEHCTLGQQRSLLEIFGVRASYAPIGLSHQIRSQLLRHSSNKLLYPFKDIGSIDYHRIVIWVAKKCGISQDDIAGSSTYELERLVMKASFSDMWDGLNREQRLKMLRKIDTKRKLDIVEVAGMSGTAALAALNASVYFYGFAFYTTMSTVIYSVAGAFSVTLPFSNYIFASVTTAFLTGPAGVALLMVGTAGSLLLLGRANWRAAMAFIVAMHCLKTEAIR